jgi:hypothetical protein
VISASESKWLKASVTAATAGSPLHTKYRVRVVPDDGQEEFESALSVWGEFARYGKDIHDFWIQVVYDPEAPESCELDKDWLHSLDLTDWFGSRSDGLVREGDASSSPRAGRRSPAHGLPPGPGGEYPGRRSSERRSGGVLEAFRRTTGRRL